jgi:hypothetical protein
MSPSRCTARLGPARGRRPGARAASVSSARAGPASRRPPPEGLVEPESQAEAAPGPGPVGRSLTVTVTVPAVGSMGPWQAGAAAARRPGPGGPPAGGPQPVAPACRVTVAGGPAPPAAAGRGPTAPGQAIPPGRASQSPGTRAVN